MKTVRIRIQFKIFTTKLIEEGKTLVVTAETIVNDGKKSLKISGVWDGPRIECGLKFGKDLKGSFHTFHILGQVEKVFPYK